MGGWADLGINAGLYARELMSHSVNAIQEEPKGSIDPSRVLEKAYSSTKARGSSTACIIALTDLVCCLYSCCVLLLMCFLSCFDLLHWRIGVPRDKNEEQVIYSSCDIYLTMAYLILV